jgi:integrase/recombinase XerD
MTGYALPRAARSNVSSTRAFPLPRRQPAVALQPSVAAQVAVYVAYLRRHGRPETTIRSCRHFLDVFALWAGRRPPGSVTAAEIDLHFIAAWADKFILRNGQPPAPSTLRQMIGTLKSFYGWLDRYDELRDRDGTRARNPMLAIDSPKVRQRPNDFLSEIESTDLLAAVVTPQERMITKLLRWTGIRNGEAISLLRHDLDLDHTVLRVRQSKTDAGLRSIPIIPDLAAELEAWLAYVVTREQVWTPTTPLLLTRNGTAMKHQHVLQSVKRVAVRAGIRVDPLSGKTSVTAHCLRRTFATDLLNRTARLEVVSKLLGHSDTRTTERYYAELLGATVRNEMFAALGITLEEGPLPPNSTEVL